MTAYEFDTTLDPAYPVLTRGNAGEIMPDIVSPLSATVFFPPLERGWRRSFTDTWDVMDWPSCPTTFAPIVGGLGTAILTTSQGVMTGREATKAGVGGEVLCNVG